MANETNASAFMMEELPGLDILEPYLGSEIVGQLQAADPLTISAVIIVVALVLATLLLLVMKITTKIIASRTKTDIDDKLLETAQQPVFRLVIIGGVYLAVANLGLEGGTSSFILRVILTLAYLTIIKFVLNVLNVIINSGVKTLAAKTESDFDDEIIPIFHKASNIVIWAFGGILILSVWGVDVTPFVAGLGIAGLAISFALQSTLSNVIAGISLIMDRTYRVGDKIKMDSGELGVVHEVSLRSTRIRTYDNEIIIIPNNTMASARIKNYTLPDLKMRVVVPFTVEYGSKPEKVIPLITKTIKKDIKGILPDPGVSVVFIDMADFALKFEARFWVGHYGDAYSKKLEGVDLIYKTLNKNKIGIPFPTQTLYVKK